MWYKRQEVQKRSSFFFNSTSIAGAFGGLLATAIGKMDGMRGYRGWRWVFILGMWLNFLPCFKLNPNKINYRGCLDNGHCSYLLLLYCRLS